MQLIFALELLRIGLVHRQLVLAPLEDLDLVNITQIASHELSLSCNCDSCFPIVPRCKSSALLLICVVVDD